MIDLFPWQQATWRELVERRRAGRLPHALLLNGPEGVGKLRLATRFAHALLCEAPDASGAACGRCKSCLLIGAGTHPDLLGVTVEEEARDIKIAQIRELIAQLSLTSQYSGYKVAIVAPAEQMNINAANSLLKTLEEPAPNTLLILATAHPSRLLPTIRSRCQQIAFAVPPREQSLQWLSSEGISDAALLLSLAGGAPLIAARLNEMEALSLRSALFNSFSALVTGRSDPISVADQWGKGDSATALGWLASWVMDMIRLKLDTGAGSLANPDLDKDLQRLSEPLDLAQLYQRLDQVVEALRLSNATINQQLLLEETMLNWSSARS